MTIRIGQKAMQSHLEKGKFNGSSHREGFEQDEPKGGSPTAVLVCPDASSSSWRNHVQSTAALCLCTLVHGYLLVSVFPYGGYMAMSLIRGVTEETAGPYAGLIASAFMAGRTVSAVPWGRLADVYGRKCVLLASLLLSGVWSLLFGMSRSLLQALCWRFLLGLSNGIVSVSKTAVSELAGGDDRREKRAMSLVVGMRAWGFLISPALGGWLAEPLEQYPNARFYACFAPILGRFPFLLPNLLGTVLCLLTTVVVIVSIDETLPIEKRRSLSLIPTDVARFISRSSSSALTWTGTTRQPNNGMELSEKTTLLPRNEEEHCNNSTLERQTVTTKNKDTLKESQNHHDIMASIWRRHATRSHLVAYWWFSFVVTCVDESFPLYCISKQGGLALPEASIGSILSGAGLLFACFQYVVYALTVERVGLYPSLVLGSALGSLPVALIPVSFVLPRRQESFVFLAILLAVCKIFSCMFFTSMSIALNKTVPSSERGSMNGLAALGGSVAKGVAPLFAGGLVALSFSVPMSAKQAYGGSLLIFGLQSAIGLMVVLASSRLVAVVPGEE